MTAHTPTRAGQPGEEAWLPVGADLETVRCPVTRLGGGEWALAYLSREHRWALYWLDHDCAAWCEWRRFPRCVGRRAAEAAAQRAVDSARGWDLLRTRAREQEAAIVRHLAAGGAVTPTTVRVFARRWDRVTGYCADGPRAEDRAAKRTTMAALVSAARRHGWTYGVALETAQHGAPWVLYLDTPAGQVSYHAYLSDLAAVVLGAEGGDDAARRLAVWALLGTHYYPGVWDGARGTSARRAALSLSPASAPPTGGQTGCAAPPNGPGDAPGSRDTLTTIEEPRP